MIILGINAYHADAAAAVEEAFFKENRRRKESGVRSEGENGKCEALGVRSEARKSPMLELVAKAIEEMVKG